MNNNKPKEKWSKPKLIILTRGKPEERLLDGCKIGIQRPTSSTTNFAGCRNWDVNCGNCQSIGNS